MPSVLIEFFAIITDSRRVENPKEPKEAVEEIEKYLLSKNILKIYPEEDTLQRTIGLVKKYNLKRQKVFDAQLVAMRALHPAFLQASCSPKRQATSYYRYKQHRRPEGHRTQSIY